MRKIKLGWLVSVPVIALLALFAASNAEPVVLRLWPLPERYALQLPLFVPVYLLAAIAYLCGGAGMWLRHRPARKVARRQHRQVKREAKARAKQGLPTEAPRLSPEEALARMPAVAVREPPRAAMLGSARGERDRPDLVA